MDDYILHAFAGECRDDLPRSGEMRGHQRSVIAAVSESSTDRSMRELDGKETETPHEPERFLDLSPLSNEAVENDDAYGNECEEHERQARARHATREELSEQRPQGRSEQKETHLRQRRADG